MPSVKEYVEFISHRPRIYLFILFLAFIGLIYYAIGIFAGTAGLKDEGFVSPDSESSNTDDLFTKQYVSPSSDLTILLSHPVWNITQMEYQNAYQDFKTQLTTALPRVYSFLSYFEYPTEFTGYSLDMKKCVVFARLHGDIVADPITMEQYNAAVSGSVLKVQFAGGSLAGATIGKL
jgi:hypothetical protein